MAGKWVLDDLRKQAESLEDLVTEGAPTDLCCPISMALFKDPVVAPSGETYDRATVLQLKESTAREPERRERYQVDAFIGSVLTEFATKLEQTLEGDSAEDFDALLPFLCKTLTLLKGRTSDAALNAKRRLTAALEARGGASAPRVGRPAQRALDDALGALDLRGLAETLMPDLPRAPAPAPAPPNPAGTAAASAAGAKPATGGVAGDEKDVGCAACGRVVRAMSGIEAGGKTYHEECFKCSGCEEAIRDRFTMAGGCPVCERCAAAAEAAEAGSRAAARPACDTCSKCGRPAEGESVEALGRVYHRACFCCAKCDERLPSAFRVVDDVPWCKGCHLEHRVARCFACARPAEGGVVTEVFPGRTWHEECFACRQCNSQLLGSFRHHGDELWCKRCYDEHKAPRCAACARPAEGGVTTSAFPGKVWHEDCFACKGCAAVLRGSFKHKDATLWCAPCYTDKFLPRCTACTKPVEGSVMTVSEATYHPACLVCGACKVQLGAKMFRHDGQLLCTPCYEDVALKKCAKCARPIRDATWPEYRGGSYHPSCFCCATCHKPVKGSFYEQDGGKGVVCKPCGRK